jgi:DNA-binding helix-hairpin-helix protein with protein kinase domain
MRVTTESGKHYQCEDVPFESGAEAELFLTTDDRKVIKLYFKANPELSRALDFIIQRYNVPRQDPYWKPFFAWPEEKITTPRPGIVMAKVPDTLQPADRFWSLRFARRRLPPAQRGNWGGHLRISFNLSRAVHRLHIAGLCHSDLSWNNILVSPVNGRCVLLDCDGLVVPNFLPPKVMGTFGCMAPEIVKGTSGPCIEADRHALAVIIYRLLTFRDPFRGPMRHPGDAAAEDELIYGKRILFIENPQDNRNRPTTVNPTISKLGRDLERLFIKAFVDGLHLPALRPPADQWRVALQKTIHRTVPCPNPDCEFKAFVLWDLKNPVCSWCGTAMESNRLIKLAIHKERNPGQFRPTDDYWVGRDGGRVPKSVFVTQSGEDAIDASIATVRKREKGWWIEPEDKAILRIVGRGKIAPGTTAEVRHGDRILLNEEKSNQLEVSV